MSSQVKAQELRLDVAPAGPATVTITTSADPRRDARLERFWETVHRLIFDEGRTLAYKRAALGRYSRLLGRSGQTEWADYAARLAGSYRDVEDAIAHW
ncbi:MAG: hypothetical protein FJZ01_05445 [Candidatus Sericytochromatia bacterium]|nr:hypothetical protein [Candidatus Tanganyikabacteria bacterium]